jgi:hypothetical protein
MKNVASRWHKLTPTQQILVAAWLIGYLDSVEEWDDIDKNALFTCLDNKLKDNENINATNPQT